VPAEYSGYCQATGNHVVAIIKAIEGAHGGLPRNRLG
jgi:hypothetical protein